MDLMMKLTIKASTIAPMIAGIIAKSAITGPQSPKIRVPNQAPMKPAIILPITPPGISLPAIKLATQPISPPIINDHKKLNNALHSFITSISSSLDVHLGCESTQRIIHSVFS